MPSEPAAPGEYIEEVASGARPIEPVGTAVAAFVGLAPKGPTDKARRVSSWAGYQRLYGGLRAGSDLGYAVSHFFANGGRQAWIVRLPPGESTIPGDDPDAFWRAAFPADPDDGTPRGGVFLLDRVDRFNLLVVPGLVDTARLAELATFCRERRAFLIADAEDTADPGAVAPIPGPEGANAAIYYPWVRMLDPVASGVRSFPPSGAVAGIYARTDAARGVWKAPAGTEATIAGARGLTRDLRDAEAGALNQRGVNVLRALPQSGAVVWGARTCQGADALASEWKYVPVRRLALFLEESLVRGLAWAVFEPNDEALWARIRRLVGDFLDDLLGRGAFQGRTQREAWFVKCDAETTSQGDIDRGVVNVLVGFAPLKPAEFVVIRLQQLAGRART